MAGGSPFATFLIVGPVCFFLGILYSSFPYDYYVLWASPPNPLLNSDPSDREPYYAQLESHLRILHASPPLISRILHIVIGTGLIGLVTKLYKPSEANMLFDGASLVLYMCGITVYIANIVKGLRTVTAGAYGTLDLSASTPVQSADPDENIIGREDTLKVLAASNTILALVLVGVLILQAGQWYAQKKEAAELAAMDAAAAKEKKEGGVKARQEKKKA